MQSTLYLVPWFISATLTFLLGLYALRHRRNLAAVPFIAMCFFGTWWTVAYLFELGIISLEGKMIAVKLGYIGILGTALSWTAFSLSYSGRGYWLTKRNIALALILPLITLVILFTTEKNHMMFRELGLAHDEPSELYIIWNPPGWWFWVHAAYTYGLILFGSYFLVKKFWGQRNLYRTQMLIVLIAIVAPWVANAVVIFRLLPAPIDITSVVFSISTILLGWAFFRYRFLDIIPVAYREVFHSISDAVIIMDRSLRVVEANPATLTAFNLKENEVLGKPFRDGFGEWIRLDETTLTSNGFHQELLVNGSAPSKWFDMNINTLWDAPNHVGGHIITLRDVTSLKEKESALEVSRDDAVRANAFKDQLLANVSHELRAPIGIIMGYADLLMRGSYGEINEDQLGSLSRIRESTQYLDGLVSELLDQAQLDSGKLQLVKVSFEPRVVFGQVCNQFKVLAEGKDLKFTCEISEDMPQAIMGDSQRLKQILVNLISNAIKFTETGGIDVRVFRASETFWKMQVTDTGNGIPPEAANIIFEPFRQLNPVAKTLRKGYGLGLSIAKQLIELMGGDIELQSEVGKGTTFTVTVPLIVPTSETTNA